MSAEQPTQTGTVIGWNGQRLQVILENDESIDVAIPRSRKFGCLFLPALLGAKVEVLLKSTPKLSRIVKLIPEP